MSSSDPYDLQRFLDAQNGTIETALAELREGAKRGHWMWFVFPQLVGLGSSPTARHYAIRSLDEARAYLDHPLLGLRLRRSAELLLPWSASRTAEAMFGPVDAMKLRSSLTLFDAAAPGEIFQRALSVVFADQQDPLTLALLDGAR